MALRKLFYRFGALNSTALFKHSIPAFRVMSSNSTLKVEHDRHNLCFTVSLAGHTDCAVLRYKITGQREVDLLSTNVPESFRGKGVAALLSKAAMDFLVEDNLKAHISCWYIKKYVVENPLLGYKDLIIS